MLDQTKKKIFTDTKRVLVCEIYMREKVMGGKRIYVGMRVWGQKALFKHQVNTLTLTLNPTRP